MLHITLLLPKKYFLSSNNMGCHRSAFGPKRRSFALRVPGLICRPPILPPVPMWYGQTDSDVKQISYMLIMALFSGRKTGKYLPIRMEIPRDPDGNTT